jgi:hypothetical protein
MADCNCMSIKVEKTTKDGFYELADFTKEVPWLDDREYEAGILALWAEYSSKDDKELVLNLLRRLKYQDDKSLNNSAYLLVEKIREWDIEHEEVVMVATSNGDEIDGSVAGMNFLKSKLSTLDGWSEKLLFSNFDAAIELIKEGKSEVIIFDDFIGSGRTMVKKIVKFEKILEELKIVGVKFRILSYAAMEHGIKYINERIDVEVYCPVLLKKGITDHEEEELANSNKILMKNLESSLQKNQANLRLKDFTLGYDESETLYQVYGHNCSNNVFPLFWWPKALGGKIRNTLFKRLR